MIRKLLFALMPLTLILAGMSCSKKEEPAADLSTVAQPEPALKPGEMVLIPGGDFVFGDNDKDSAAFPQQTISLPAFWIDKYEVTNSQYLDFSIKGEYMSEGKDWRLFFTPEKANYPVLNITWDDAVAFCKWAGKRLPNEMEWEKAARGTDGRRYPWGDNWDSSLTNTFEAGMRSPVQVATYRDVSPYGVFDMLGNVQEWTDSWYVAYKGNSKKDQNFGERFRVVRGGSSNIYGSRAHLWDRSAYVPKALYGFGFRCAKDATADEAQQAGAPK